MAHVRSIGPGMRFVSLQVMSPLTNKTYLLEKFPGKGGWTFARIPEIEPDKKAHFGWVRVKGSIDGYSISKYHLMPMGDGKLFLPVKLEIRKKIRKNEGDTVHIILFLDEDPIEVPEEMMLCLRDEPTAFNFFNSLSDSEKNACINWIYSAKKEETKVNRLARIISDFAKGRSKFSLIQSREI